MSQTPSRDQVGLCSVTLRALDPVEVVRHVVKAGLRRVEWGADRHAPPGDAVRHAVVRDLSADAGLVICSYGSYWRAGQDSIDDAGRIITAASSLGTDRVRIWAGTTPSAAADSETWLRTAAAVQQAADLAADFGISLAFEFHGGTLTDTVPGTVRLLEQVGRDNVSTYWQPPVGLDDAAALDGLRLLRERVSAVHVFSWWPDTTRRRLSQRSELWLAAIQLLAGTPKPVDLLLEFVPEDDPALLAPEAETLLRWVRRAATIK